MKRFLSVMLTAVMLAAMVPAQVSSEDGIAATPTPTAAVTAQPAPTDAPAATPSPTPSPSPAPAEEASPAPEMPVLTLELLEAPEATAAAETSPAPSAAPTAAPETATAEPVPATEIPQASIALVAVEEAAQTETAEAAAETEEIPAATETPEPEMLPPETAEANEPEAELPDTVEIIEIELEIAEEAAEEIAEPAEEPLEVSEAVEPEAEILEAAEVAEPETELAEVIEIAEPEQAEAAEAAEAAVDLQAVEEVTEPEPVIMEVTAVSSLALLAGGAETLAAPRVVVSPALVKYGDDLRIIVYAVDNATAYAVNIYNTSGTAVGSNTVNRTTSFAIPIKTSQLRGGLYRVVVTASAEGYADVSTETTFRTMVVELTASTATPDTGTAYTLTANAPEADSLTLYEDDQAVGGTGPSWQFTHQTTGSHAYRLEAKFADNTLTAEATVTVTASKGDLDQASISAPGTVEEGSGVRFTVGAVTNAERYIVRVYDPEGETVLQDTADTAKDYELEAAELDLGEYRIAVTVQAAGYAPSTAEKRFSVVEPVERAASLTADKTEVAVGESAVLTLSAPEADSAVLYRKAEGGEEQEAQTWTGEIPATCTVTSDAVGVYTYRLAARYGEETVSSESVTVRFIAKALATPQITLSQQTVKIGETISVSVQAVENATAYIATIYEASGSKKNEVAFNQTANFTFPINTATFAAGQYDLSVKAQAEGYAEAESTDAFQVVEVTLTASALTVDVGGEVVLTATATGAAAVELLREGDEEPIDTWDSEDVHQYSVSPDEAGEFTYSIQALYGERWIASAAVTVEVREAVKLTASASSVETGTAYTLHAAAPDADSLALYENDETVSGAGPDWQLTHYAAGEYAYLLEAKYGDTVKQAEIAVTVTASKGSLAQATLEFADTIEQTANLSVTLGAVPNAESYQMVIYDQTERAVARVSAPRPGTSTLRTAGALPLGEYRVVVTAQAAGYNESVSEKSFTIVEEVDRTLTLTASAASVTTMQAYTLTLTAPGADALELQGFNEAEEAVYTNAWEAGGTQTVSVTTAFAGTVRYVPRARFGEEWEEGEPVSVKVTAAKGELDETTLNYPYQVGSGQTVTVTFTAVTNATSYTLRMIDALTGEMAQTTTLSRAQAWNVSGLADSHYILEAEAAAPGYNASVTKGSLHVGVIDQTVEFTVPSATVATGADITLNINAPHADQLRLYVKAGSGEEKLQATFDYAARYTFTYDSAAALTLRLEGLLNGEWVPAAATRTVNVTAPSGNLQAPAVDVASQIQKGDTLIFTVTKADNAVTQTVTIGLRTGTAVTKVYDGAAVSRYFKLDTSRLREGEYVITATSAAPGYNAASATTSVYVGTPATATPTASPTPTVTPVPTATAKATATAKPTATPKATATKKPSSSGGSSSSSGSSSRATATPRVTATATVMMAVTVTPTVTATLQPSASPSAAPTAAPAVVEDGIMYRDAINIQETYGVDTNAELDAFYMLLEMGESMNSSAASNGTRYSIAGVDSILSDNEMQVFNSLLPKDKLFVTACAIGMDDFIDIFDESELSVQAWVLIDDIRMRIEGLSNQEKQARDELIQRLFGQPATANGDTVYGIDVTITNGFTTRYERYTFRKDEIWDWLLYRIYIGTSLGNA